MEEHSLVKFIMQILEWINSQVIKVIIMTEQKHNIVVSPLICKQEAPTPEVSDTMNLDALYMARDWEKERGEYASLPVSHGMEEVPGLIYYSHSHILPVSISLWLHGWQLYEFQ